MQTNGFMNKAELDEVARKGKEIYETIKGQYEPQFNGKFLVIAVESGNVYFGETDLEASLVAIKESPNERKFLIRIGFDFVERLIGYTP